MRNLIKKVWFLLMILSCVIFLAFFTFFSFHFTKNFIENGTKEAVVPPIEIDYYKTPDTPFLKEEEMIIIEKSPQDREEFENEQFTIPITKVLFEYIEVTDGCSIHFEGECLNVRSGPGTEYPVVANLRNGIVLKVGGKVERDNEVWYRIVFDEWLRYPERVKSDWYVSADYVKILYDEGEKTTQEDGKATTSKYIIVKRSEQKLYAYDGEELFMELYISTGLELTPTPRGEFTIFRKTPSRYMQGPLPYLQNSKYFDLPGVPWNLYFTKEGAVIHGTYWHNSFGSAYSSGCVNLPIDKVRELYYWAPLGTKVIVRD